MRNKDKKHLGLELDKDLYLKLFLYRRTMKSPAPATAKSST